MGGRHSSSGSNGSRAEGQRAVIGQHLVSG